MTSKLTREDGAVKVAARLLIGALILGFLYFGKVVLIPLGLALLFAFMLQPVVRRLRRLRLPRVVAVFTTVILFAALLGGLTWLIGGQLSAFTAELPAARDNIVAKISQARRAMKGGTIAQLQTTIETVAEGVKSDREAPPQGKEDEPAPVPVTISEGASWANLGGLASIGPVISPLATASLVALLVVLMLLQWADLRSRLVGLLTHNVTGATNALDDAGRRIGRYLGMQLLVNSSFGLVVGVGLYLLGVPYAALWGLCAALFRYVPYAGPVVAAALPLFVSLVTSDGWSQFLAVAALFVVLETISNNFVEPWLYGSSLGISEIGIILTAVVWTVLWGAPGLVLSTPLTVCLVVLGEHVPSLRFFSVLLSDKPIQSRHYQFYERLLARDDIEATQLVKQFAGEEPDSAAPDALVVPALAFARREQSLRRLADDQAGELLDRVRRVVPPVEEDGNAAAPDPAAPLVPVVLWSICAFGDAAQEYLAARLASLPCQIESVRSTELIGHVLARLGELERPPAAVALIQLHGSDHDRVRGLLKRLRAAFPSLPVTVARWDGERLEGDENAALTRAGATAVAGTMARTREWLGSLVVEESCKYR